jgi:hypothetical protein
MNLLKCKQVIHDSSPGLAIHGKAFGGKKLCFF